MAFDIGINVVEVDGATAPSITGAATSVAGFCVSTERGVPNRPTRVTNYTQFVERFGGYLAGSFGAYLVKGFFDNGGRTAYINRAIDDSADTAKLTLKSGTGNAPDVLTIEGGFRGEADPGTWARRLFVKVAHSSKASSILRETSKAKITGDTVGDTVDMKALPPLRLEVDGDPLEIIFKITDFGDSAAATQAEIKAAITKQTPWLEVKFDSNKLTLTSTGERAAEKKGFTSLKAEANTALKIAATTGAGEVGEVVSFKKDGTTLADATKFAVGDLIEIRTDTKEASARVTVVDPATGAISWAPDVATPNQFTVRNIVVSTTEFDLVIAKGKGDDANVVETHAGLSMHSDLANFVGRVLGDPLTGSRYVKGTVPAGQTSRPVETAWTPLAGGVDGTVGGPEFIGDEAERTGIYAFDPFDIQLLCTESTLATVANKAIGYCEKRGDAMFVGSVPKNSVAAGKAVDYGNGLASPKGYGALYGPWVVVSDPAGVGDNPMLTIPPTGHVMGVYARIETTRGIWKAPAGDEANLRGVLDVETRLSAADHTDLVVNGAVNGVRAIPRAGVVVDASRTLSSDPRWRYVNVRLLFNYVKSSLRDGLRWARQEPNRDTLWRSIRISTVTPFLLGLWRQGAFGTGSPDQTFTVIIDETNNPPDLVDQGFLKCEVYFYPSRPAETIVIVVGQQPSGATVSEA